MKVTIHVTLNDGRLKMCCSDGAKRNNPLWKDGRLIILGVLVSQSDAQRCGSCRSLLTGLRQDEWVNKGKQKELADERVCWEWQQKQPREGGHGRGKLKYLEKACGKTNTLYEI